MANSLVIRMFSLLRKRCASIGAVFFFGTGVLSVLPLSAFGSPVDWKEAEPGLQFGRYRLEAESPMMRAEVLLIRIDPLRFNLRLVQASVVKQPRAAIADIAAAADALIALNTHYFDTDGKALGLIINSGAKEHHMHKGGSVLTGVFYLKDNTPAIVHRSEISRVSPDLALQAGPRIVVAGKATELKRKDKANRRSGIAVTGSGEIVLYATPSRFPGARLSQIQQMLLDPELKIRDALNLDGGSSSQLFVSKVVSPSGEDIHFSGGDKVPVGLVVTRKSND